MKLNMPELEIEQIIQVLEQPPSLCKGSYADPEFYIEQIRTISFDRLIFYRQLIRAKTFPQTFFP
jgi:hypothetical protein